MGDNVIFCLLLKTSDNHYLNIREYSFLGVANAVKTFLKIMFFPLLCHFLHNTCKAIWNFLSFYKKVLRPPLPEIFLKQETWTRIRVQKVMLKTILFINHGLRKLWNINYAVFVCKFSPFIMNGGAVISFYRLFSSRESSRFCFP